MADYIGNDIHGYDVLTKAVLDMLDAIDENIMFEELSDTHGTCFSNDTGSLILTEKNYITGGFERECSYPFFIVHRSVCKDEKARLKANVYVNRIADTLCTLTSYPDLGEGRKITKIIKQNAYGTEINTENSVQDWIVPVTVEYTFRKEF